MKQLFLSIFVFFCASPVFASARPVLNCADSSENIVIDSVNQTIERGGVTYSFNTIKSFFGLILDPVNPSDGVADLNWGVRVMGALAIEDIKVATGIILDTNSGTSHTPLSCE